MTCKRAHLAISRFLDGELDPTGQSRLNRHLERCPECSAYLDDLRQGLSALKALPMEEPSANFEWNLRRKIQAAEAEHRVLEKQRTVSFWPRFAVSAAAALLLSLGGASVWYASLERGTTVPGDSPAAPAGRLAGGDAEQPVIGPQLEGRGFDRPESGFRAVGENKGAMSARQHARTIQPSDETVALPLVKQRAAEEAADSLAETAPEQP
jgi:hypothetical protein